MSKKIEEIKEKLEAFVNKQIEYAEKNGSTRWDTCGNAHHGWDIDIWAHKYSIMDAIRAKGYDVRSETNHGVLDVFVTKPIKLFS